MAKIFKKSKIKTILNAIGLYFLGAFASIFILSFLLSFGIIDVGLDFSQIATGKMDADTLKANSEVINNFLIQNYIPTIMQVLLFILIGIIYFQYLKNKWMKEILAENAEKLEGLNESIQPKPLQIIPIKTNFYTHFHQVNEKNIHLVPRLAEEIWNDCYKDIISKDQIDFMLEMMYNEEKINEAISNGEQWEILKADNEPVGYLHYKLEDDKVFLSKIYLKQDPKFKGLGQVMLNHVIDYALVKQMNKIYLTVNKNNIKAIRFYEKNGFKNIQSETFDIGNGFVMDDYIYQKDIN